jgi:hypothetical protein
MKQFRRFWFCVDLRDNTVLYLEHDFGHNQPPGIDPEANVFPLAGMFPTDFTPATCAKFEYVDGAQVALKKEKLTQRQSLLRQKYVALAKIMKVVYWGRTKVNKGWLQQDAVYKMKLDAAVAYLNKEENPPGLAMLQHEADLRKTTVYAMAKAITIAAQDNERILIDTENFRQEWTQKIRACSSLLELQQVMDTLRSESYIPVTMGFLQ